MIEHSYFLFLFGFIFKLRLYVFCRLTEINCECSWDVQKYYAKKGSRRKRMNESIKAHNFFSNIFQVWSFTVIIHNCVPLFSPIVWFNIKKNCNRHQKIFHWMNNSQLNIEKKNSNYKEYFDWHTEEDEWKQSELYYHHDIISQFFHFKSSKHLGSGCELMLYGMWRDWNHGF